MTMEGRRIWDVEMSKTSKGTARSAEKFHDFRTELSIIAADHNISQEIKDAVKHLMSHLYKVYQTLDELTTSNHDFLLENTGGTFSVPKRDLKTMIESIPMFTGETDDDSHPWSDIEAALENIKEAFFLKTYE